MDNVLHHINLCQLSVVSVAPLFYLIIIDSAYTVGFTVGCQFVDMDTTFLDQVENFVQGILKPDNLVVKCINGQPIRADAIIKLLEDNTERLESGNLPAQDSMTEVYRPILVF